MKARECAVTTEKRERVGIFLCCGGGWKSGGGGEMSE